MDNKTLFNMLKMGTIVGAAAAAIYIRLMLTPTIPAAKAKPKNVTLTYWVSLQLFFYREQF